MKTDLAQQQRTSSTQEILEMQETIDASSSSLNKPGTKSVPFEMKQSNPMASASSTPSESVVNKSFTSKRVSSRVSSSSSAGNPLTAAGRLRAYKSNSTSKWVTREIAALEFLLGIPMQAERDIVHQGWMQQQGQDEVQEENHKSKEGDEEAKVELLEPPTENSNFKAAVIADSSHHGKWWEKWINNQNLTRKESLSRQPSGFDDALEQPNEIGHSVAAIHSSQQTQQSQQQVVPLVHAPGRRLEGDEAFRVQIPLTVDTSVTRQKDVARMAVTREWEMQVAHGIANASNYQTSARNKTALLNKQVQPPMLDGRLFFSAAESYPIQVFSLLRYEPKKEEAIRRRQKLEARGGGGTQFFIMPVRDWRGISYRALLPTRNAHKRRPKKEDAMVVFDRFASSPTLEAVLRGESKNILEGSKKPLGTGEELLTNDDDDEETDEEEDTYVTGLLDDPDMVQGRHRTVMIGDRVTGPIVSSTILFVNPALLKADLNKQFRERFDGWEPPKSQRKYIGARVVDGAYTLMDPGSTGDDGTVGTVEDDSDLPTVTTATKTSTTAVTPRKRQGSMSSLSTGGADPKETIRMPPSLTLSKIRSVKRQALIAAVNAKIEISTVALAIVYFERLCLDCRVDKTNRRLTFAACLLLAIKINEAHVGLVMTKTAEEDDDLAKSTTTARIKSLIRPTKKSRTIFASLLEFFTQDWNISLKHLFAAEWGVFAALQFRLHAKPSHVAFHFRRLLKSLDWNPRTYLGAEMYGYWQEELAREDYLRVAKESRREVRQQKNERKKLMQLQRELEAAKQSDDDNSSIDPDDHEKAVRGHQLTKGRSDEDVGEKPKYRKIVEHSPMGGLNKKLAPRASKIGSLLHRFSGVKRVMSTDKLSQQHHIQEQDHEEARLSMSPSMPVIAGSFSNHEFGDDFIIDISMGLDGDGDADDFGSNKSVVDSDEGVIMV